MRTNKQPLGDFLRKQQQTPRTNYSSFADMVSGVTIEERIRKVEEESLRTFQEDLRRQRLREEEENRRILNEIAEAERREEASWQAVVSKRGQ